MFGRFLELIGCKKKRERECVGNPNPGQKLYIVMGIVRFLETQNTRKGTKEVKVGVRVYYLNTFTDYDAAIRCCDEWMNEPVVRAWNLPQHPGRYAQKDFYIARHRLGWKPEQQACRHIWIGGYEEGEMKW